MKSTFIGLALVLSTALPALGGDVPYAGPRSDRPEHVQRLLMPSLADLMSMIQLRHIKLWYAGYAKNWAVADYEIDRMEASFVKAVILYNSIPMDHTTSVDQSLADIRNAIKAKSSKDFNRGFMGLTAACNSCHASGNVGFIHIRIPTSMPLSNQIFRE